MKKLHGRRISGGFQIIFSKADSRIRTRDIDPFRLSSEAPKRLSKIPKKNREKTGCRVAETK